MNIAYRLWQTGNKFIPCNHGSIMTSNQHIIDTGPCHRRQIVPCQSSKPTPRPVSHHRISNFFCCCKAKPPFWLSRLNGLDHYALGKRLVAFHPCRDKAGARRNCVNRRHRIRVSSRQTALGRQACTTLSTARLNNPTPTDGGHPRTKPVATFTNQNTWLIGAFHLNAPL